jgi:hypothetical protein
VLDGEINEKAERHDWHEPECLIKFIPDNDFVK